MPFRPRQGKSISGSLFDRAPANAPEHHLVAYIDGGARGNPGPAAYGVVVQDENGRKVAELSEFLGRQTNNYAEYSGLVAALNYAVQHGVKALKVVSDSELMVKQINGQYKVGNPALKELHGRAKKSIAQLDYFHIRHVLREKNRDADRLANQAMDRGMGKKTEAMTDQPGVVPEVNGLVRNGVVEFLGTPLPDGSLVKVRAVPRTKNPSCS
ncbi:MAG: ribonuclease HI family protein [Acidobacteriota bacterium]|nr:ribonuclease HI family protein [Acidobacteriota bacterium]